MKGRARRVLLQSLLLAFLAGCSDDDDAFVVMPSPPPAPPVPPVTLTGVVAVGAAVDGATISVLDALGAAIDVGAVITGSDGSYSVELPADTPLPVILLAALEGREPIASIVAESPSDDGALVAHLNPVTTLLAGEIVGADLSDSAAIAAALGIVATDVTSVSAAGDELVMALFGAGVSFERFASDPAFVADDGSGETPAVADTLLDALAEAAEDEGLSLTEKLAVERAEGAAGGLLNEPEFQVDLVGRLLLAGNPAAELEARLDEVGALAQSNAGSEDDSFRAVLATVPALVESVQSRIAALPEGGGLETDGAAAALEMLEAFVDSRTDDFGDDSASLAVLLSSQSFATTLGDVVVSLADDLLQASGSDAERVVAGDVLRAATVRAGQALSTIAPAAIESRALGGLLQSHVEANVLVADLAERLAELASGAVDLEDVVSVPTTIGETRGALEALIAADPELVGDAGDGELLAAPEARWDETFWDGSDWS